MKIFIPLSEWKERKVARGRTAGDVIKTRWVLALDNWNWIIANQTEKDDGPISNMFYYQNFKILIPAISRVSGLDTKTVVPKIVGALKRSLNIDMTGQRLPPSDITSEKMGVWIDDIFSASFAREYPPKVYRRLFPTDTKLEEKQDRDSLPND